MDGTMHCFLLLIIPALVHCGEEKNTFHEKSLAQNFLDLQGEGNNSSLKASADATKKRQMYLKRFSQSWKLYAKANDITKREKLRKALLDALKSMETKKKSTMSTLTHDTVYRIKHAASMLKEFKKMYQLSKDVMKSWKDYQTARKSLIVIGNTEEGGNLLKRYVILRNNISKHYKRTKIERPTIVDDTDIDNIRPQGRPTELVVKDKIGGKDTESKAGNLLGNNVATPGTLQIIRFRKTEVNRGTSEPVNNVGAGGLLDARAAYSKAKETVEDANKDGTQEDTKNKKSVLTIGDDTVKQEAMGHVNSHMSISSLIKKAENEDLQSITGSNSMDNGNQYGSTAIIQKPGNEIGQNQPQSTALKEQGNTVELPPRNVTGNDVPTNSPSNKSAALLTTSLTSVMDSLAESEENSARPTENQKGISSASNSQPSLSMPNPVQYTNNMPIVASTAQGQSADASVNAKALLNGLENSTESKTVEPVNNSSNISSVQNANGNQTSQIQSEQTNTTNISGTSQPAVNLKMIYKAATSIENKQIEINKQPTINAASNKSENTKAFQDISQMVAMPMEELGVKKFHLNESAIQEEVVKTVDRQLETLKRLHEAKQARRKFDAAKRELQSKIKNLYDMAVTFEKPKNGSESKELNTKAFISPLPSDSDAIKDLHPGVALAGINDRAVTPVQTPSDNGEHHGFTLGGLDGGSSAHIVDLQEQNEGSKVEKVYQVKLPEGSKEISAAVRKSESGANDKALKSLTDAIQNDLQQIEQNEAKRKSERRKSDALKNVVKPLFQAFASPKQDKQESTAVAGLDEITKTADLQTPTNKMGEKKSDSASENNEKTENVEAKTQDAFKEVEEYLSKALKHVAKEAVSEEPGPAKDAVEKEETNNAEKQSDSKSTEKTEDNKDGDAKVQSEKVKEGEEDKNGKKKDNAKDEKLLKIVEDAMKEHSRDPTSPHPVNTDLINELSTKQKDETKPKVVNVEPEKSAASTATETPNNTTGKTTDEEKKSESKDSTTKSNPAPTNTERSADAKEDSDAISKAEHMEEEAAKLQEKLYGQGTPTDAYKSIEPQKPLFTQDGEETPEYQQTYKDPAYHHRHKHHHRYYDDAQDEEETEPADDNDDEDDEDDEEANSRSYENDEDDEDYDDDADRRRKKSYLQSSSMHPYRNFQRDMLFRHQAPFQPPEMMNRGMMGNDAEEGHEELEDSKKSYVPTSTRAKAGEQSSSSSKRTFKPNLMYTL